MADAKSMLLVDHRKPEIGKRDTLLNERMGADGDVDFAFRQRGKRGAARRRPRSRPVMSLMRNPIRSASGAMRS